MSIKAFSMDRGSHCINAKRTKKTQNFQAHPVIRINKLLVN